MDLVAVAQFDALLDSSYTMFSPKADIQLSINTRRERIESGQGVGGYALMRSFGLIPLFQPTGTAGTFRGGFELNNHVLTVIGTKVYDLDTPTHINFTYPGTISNDGSPVRIAASLATAIIVTGGNLYRLNGGVITQPAISFIPVDIVYIDGDFVAIVAGSAATPAALFFSTDDGVTWNPSNTEQSQVSGNNFVGAIVQEEVLYVYGNRNLLPYVVGSNANAPFDLQKSGASSFGLQALNSLKRVGKFRYWLGQNEEGDAVIYRAQGYNVQRISNLALENQIRLYEKTFGVADAIGQSYQESGQEYYRIIFPSADASWELNCTITEQTGRPEWNQIAWWDFKNGLFHRHRANMLLSAFGKILAGDYTNGWLYEMSPDQYTDYGFPLRLLRRAPHIVQSNHNMSYDQLEVLGETGVGLVPPLWLQSYSIQRAAFVTLLVGQVSLGNVTAQQAVVLQQIYDFVPYTPLNPYPTPNVMNTLGFVPWGGPASLINGTVLGSPPTIGMQYSKNGGKNFSMRQDRSLGMAGDDVRILMNRCGVSRDQVFQLTFDQPVKLALTTSFLDMEELDS